MSPEEAEAMVPNGWRMLKPMQPIPIGNNLRMHKHFENEWHAHEWNVHNAHYASNLSNYYAVLVNEPRKEW